MSQSFGFNTAHMSVIPQASRSFCAKNTAKKARCSAARWLVSCTQAKRSTLSDHDNRTSSISLPYRRHVITTTPLLGLGLVFMQDACAPTVAYAYESDSLELMEYVSTKDGYRMEYPKTWKVSDKKGANIIYEDPALKYNTVAVLVYPVRIKSLEQFGTLEFAASKLLAVENSKEITLSSKLVNSRAFDTPTGLAYEIEYEVTTDYGTKINVAVVTVANGKLYNLNVQYGKSGFYGEASPSFIGSIREVLDSFSVVL